jgi:type VI protein secretion system component VasF
MTLQDLCESLFLYLCRVSRRARAGEAISAREVRDALINTLADLRAKAAPDHHLRAQFSEIEPALVLFIDEVFRGSDWPFARSWQTLPERAHLSAETDRFFALVDEALADPCDAAAERLAVLHTCISLAFLGRPGFEHSREKLGLISLRLATLPVDGFTSPPITVNLARRTRRILVPLTVTILCSSAAVIAAQLRSYYRDARQLHSTIRSVASATQPAPSTAEPAR